MIIIFTILLYEVLVHSFRQNGSLIIFRNTNVGNIDKVILKIEPLILTYHTEISMKFCENSLAWRQYNHRHWGLWIQLTFKVEWLQACKPRSIDTKYTCTCVNTPRKHTSVVWTAAVCVMSPFSSVNRIESQIFPVKNSSLQSSGLVGLVAKSSNRGNFEIFCLHI